VDLAAAVEGVAAAAASEGGLPLDATATVVIVTIALSCSPF
jgi:hypothetical protein